MKICNDVRIIIAALLRYQHMLDIYMAPNETPESRDPISYSRFKIAHPPVNTCTFSEPRRVAEDRQRNVRTRYAFHIATHFSIAESNFILPNSRRSRLFQLTPLPQSLLSSPSISVSFAAAVSSRTVIFAPRTFKHHRVASLPAY